MFGEIGADGRYAVCTGLPHFMLGRLGEDVQGFPGESQNLSIGPVSSVVRTMTLFYLAVSSDPVRGRIRTRTGLG